MLASVELRWRFRISRAGRPRRRLAWIAAAILSVAAAADARGTPADPEFLKQTETGPAAAEPSSDALIERGRQIFTTETFGGNGRTCATCHRPDDNYTIDPAYIAKLPPSDPLFVSETRKALAKLDDPTLLRRLALVSVNIDGFDKPAVARAVPFILGLGQTMEPEPFALIPPGKTEDLKAALGWSGDGAPGDGALRRFAVGAVIQHMPKTLARKPGTDFRLPTADELEALEAFMLSLGRRVDIDISNSTGMRFAAPVVEQGRGLFNSEVSGPCSFCHANAGARNDGGFNGMFDTGIARRVTTPAHTLDPALAGDGGFGASPTIRLGDRTGFGDGRFNTPSIIESADTAPYFHDNSATTLEAAVRFYTTVAFARSPGGQQVSTVSLSTSDVVAIAAMLRTVNAMDNVATSNAALARAMRQPLKASRATVALASHDTDDAILVLATGPRRLYPGSVTRLRQARALEDRARSAATVVARDDLLRRAATLKQQAGEAMVAR